MGVAIGIDHLTLLDASPSDLVGIASGAGFDTVGLRVAPVGPGEEPWPMAAGSPMLKETLGRLADTGVRVLPSRPCSSRLPRGQSPGDSDLQLESRAMRLLLGDGKLPLVEFLAALPAGLPVSVEAPCLRLRRELAPDEFARRARQRVARIRSAKVRP
jgi:hypothetical protein